MDLFITELKPVVNRHGKLRSGCRGTSRERGARGRHHARIVEIIKRRVGHCGRIMVIIKGGAGHHGRLMVIIERSAGHHSRIVIEGGTGDGGRIKRSAGHHHGLISVVIKL